MTSFKELFIQKAFNQASPDSSVSIRSLTSGHCLSLRFSPKDIIVSASYSGKADPWLSSLCHLVTNKSLEQALVLEWKDWDVEFKDDQTYWELKQDQSDDFIFTPLELLRAAIDTFRARDFLYQEASPLICRCFGVREKEVQEHLRATPLATLETLTLESKAGMGCRSCVPQLKRWLVLHDPKKRVHHFKDRSHADWLIHIDYMISCFPESLDYRMEVQSFRNSQVLITYEKEVPQRVEEEISKELQTFLRAAVDSELSFLLRRKKLM
ncbi:MAG TPA: (2Fe-2S)-binding protein [Bacteriovoracaceae bacterium]|nr:(2Fe-2S)-binding protein [Bacteriovoracaceae bacterium]